MKLIAYIVISLSLHASNYLFVSAARTHKQIILLLLLISGDIHPNHGPTLSNRHTCRLCNARVRVTEKVICCDVCDAWFHISCTRINSTVSRFEGSRVSWICERCDSSNFSQTCFRLHLLLSVTITFLQFQIF